MALLRKNKAFALLSIIATATVFGVLVFSVSGSEDVAVEETPPAFWGFHNRWLDTLTDDQLATLKEMIEENRAEVKNQLGAWGVEKSELNDEQREQLKTMIEENHAEVKAQLEAWGVEIPVCQGPMGLQGSGLTEEQLEELQTMRQEYLDSVNAKLEEWGVEVPEFAGPRPNGFGGFGMGSHGGAGGFSPFKP